MGDTNEKADKKNGKPRGRRRNFAKINETAAMYCRTMIDVLMDIDATAGGVHHSSEIETYRRLLAKLGEA